MEGRRRWLRGASARPGALIPTSRAIALGIFLTWAGLVGVGCAAADVWVARAGSGAGSCRAGGTAGKFWSAAGDEAVLVGTCGAGGGGGGGMRPCMLRRRGGGMAGPGCSAALCEPAWCCADGAWAGGGGMAGPGCSAALCEPAWCCADGAWAGGGGGGGVGGGWGLLGAGKEGVCQVTGVGGDEAGVESGFGDSKGEVAGLEMSIWWPGGSTPGMPRRGTSFSRETCRWFSEELMV